MHLIFIVRSCRLVSHECYPYDMDDNTNAYNTCNISIITDKHGKSHATEPCPNWLEDSNYLYKCSPPYRVPSNVSHFYWPIYPVDKILKFVAHNSAAFFKLGGSMQLEDSPRSEKFCSSTDSLSFPLMIGKCTDEALCLITKRTVRQSSLSPHSPHYYDQCIAFSA